MSLATLIASSEPNGFWWGDIKEVYWSIISVSVVVYGLVKFALPGIKKGLKDRTAKIEAALFEAEAAKVEATSETAKQAAAVADPEPEAKRIVAEAQETAVQLEAQLRERADAEAIELRNRARSEIEGSQAQAVADLRADVSNLARGAAEEVVRGNLDAATQAALIDDFINQVGAQR